MYSIKCDKNMGQQELSETTEGEHELVQLL